MQTMRGSWASYINMLTQRGNACAKDVGLNRLKFMFHIPTLFAMFAQLDLKCVWDFATVARIVSVVQTVCNTLVVPTFDF